MTEAIARALSVVIMLATLYTAWRAGLSGWLKWLGSYLWGGVTTSRTVTVGGFVGGLLAGEVFLTLLFGAVGGLGTLALGGVVSIPAKWFGAIVVIIILFFAVTGGGDD